MGREKNHRAWVVTVDMGYGHQRATFPLRRLARQAVINANSYDGIPGGDRKTWETSRHFYEFISRFTRLPIIGQPVFDLYDRFQAIPDFYPKRDLSEPSLQLREIIHLIKGKNWGKDLIERLNQSPRPLITSFFVVAFMAEYFNYQGEIYCVICDADIARVWADLKTVSSRINYFAPCYRVVERLKLYGVRPERIFLTGFPLPKENLGGPALNILKHDLSNRLVNLDPLGRYRRRYGQTVAKHLGIKHQHKKTDHPLTLSFAVGGAGAQRELGGVIVSSLRKEILKKKIRINLIAGTHAAVKKYFEETIKENGLKAEAGQGIRILYSKSKTKYFLLFNRLMRQTDILWTKPSELTFYSALGIPIVMSPPIGSQEKFNKLWLKTIGAGISQNNPKYTSEWLFDWVESGWLAQAAMRGFLEMPRLGTYNIEKILAHKPEEMEEVRTVLQY
ncbi:MAG: hypothetical protein HY982_02290 [Candidatus Magasanikbacteria bacterium]|nr:hypothetical protein [Candidatus Magasanikbacteria bacterium]